MNTARLLGAGLIAATLWVAGGARAAGGADGAGVVDTFDAAQAWTAVPADGVEMKLSADAGVTGSSLRVDFRFVKGGGYAVLHRELDLELPDNYRFTFRLRGECLPNNLEFKLIDSTGANVWWCNRRDVHFPREWGTVTIRKRHISFAWGPAGGGEIRRVAALEFAITAGSGGTGTVWLDDLALEPLPPPSATPPPPVARASSERSGHAAGLAADGDSTTWWGSAGHDRSPWFALDLGEAREFGGLVVDWLPGYHARSYAVDLSDDGATWRTARTVRASNGGRDYLYLPESEARHLRLRALGQAATCQVGVRELRVQPLEWAGSLEAFYRAIAGDAPRGSYPRGISGEQSFWTVVGVDGDTRESLIGEDGAIETGKAAFSVEPFLYVGRRLVTWSDVERRHWLDGDHLPIPGVEWSRDSLALTIEAFATGEPGASSVVARYRVLNRSSRLVRGRLFLALRPFQVNPPVQFLNTPGGVAPIRDLAREGRLIRVNGDRGIVSLTEPAGFGATSFDEGDVVEFLRAGRLPPRARVADPFAHASGALAYPFDLAPGAEREVDLLIPLHALPAAAEAWSDARARAFARETSDACRSAWSARADRVTIAAPAAAGEALHALEAQLGWILVNRDSAAIQPGSRSYERSWIRDGSLTSSALLRLGQTDVVRDFIVWFARHQYADGKVPCCVDYRGSDPVPEHDSHGEFIYLVAEYHRYTGDRALAGRMWPHVRLAAAYIDSLRQQRRSPEWRVAERRHFFGLLPPSISHEGYSAKPMHSYWDDLFALRGLKDAVYLAGVLGLDGERSRLARIRDEFQRELVASVAAAMAVHRIDYVPGCADLGDFDATSTTIALNPVQAEAVLPRAALERTFEKYWENFRDRRDGRQSWEAYTPYEMRSIGAFVRLGWRDRAQELLEFFLRYRRPPGWQQWAEVVWRDERTPHFIGDLPHTWVGSDYVRSVLDMLAYDRERDSSLVVGAGVPAAWLEGDGIAVTGLRTPYGALGCGMRARDGGIEVSIAAGGIAIPPGGIAVRAPGVTGAWTATVNGAPAAISAEGEVVVRALPATVTLRH